MKSFFSHKPDLLTAIYNGLSFLFVWVFLPEKSQNLSSPAIRPKTYRNGFFFKSWKSEIKLEIKTYPSFWAASYYPFKKLSYWTQQMFIYIDILLTLY